MSDTHERRAAYAAYKELEPILDKVTEMMVTCPIDDRGKRGLAILVSAHFFGCLLAAFQLEPTRENAQEIAGLIVASMKSGAH
jgi:hypothetical protein